MPSPLSSAGRPIDSPERTDTDSGHSEFEALQAPVPRFSPVAAASAELLPIIGSAPHKVSFSANAGFKEKSSSQPHRVFKVSVPDPALFQTKAERTRARALRTMERNVANWTIEHHGRALTNPDKFELATNSLIQNGVHPDTAEDMAESLIDAYASAREEKMALNKFGALDDPQLLAQLKTALTTEADTSTPSAAPRPFLDLKNPDNALPMRPVGMWKQADERGKLLTQAMSDIWPEMGEKEGEAIAKSIIRRTQLPQNVVLTAISYVQRLNPYIRDLRAASQRSGTPLLDGQKVLTAALMLAYETLHDVPYSTKAWAEASGLSAEDVKKSRYFLIKALGHQTMPEQAEFGAKRNAGA
jgi:hypothetical protein